MASVKGGEEGEGVSSDGQWEARGDRRHREPGFGVMRAYDVCG